MSNPPPPSIPGGTPPPPSIPTPPAAPSVPKAPAAPSVPPASGAPAAPAAPAAPPAAAAPTIPLRPAGLGGGIKLGGGLKTVALGSATTPVAPPAGAAPAAAAPTVPLTPPGAGMATAQLPQATIGLNPAPAAAPVSSASFTAKKFEEDTEASPNTLLNILSFVALAFALIFVGYQYATDTLEARSMTGWLGSDSKPAAAAPTSAGEEATDDAAAESSSDDASSDAPAEESSDDGADAEE